VEMQFAELTTSDLRGVSGICWFKPIRSIPNIHRKQSSESQR
jgi:hypothetical protein